ncbi:phosphonate metabolism transcriptional regulator PhnF [Rhizobium sp. AC27/96]|uniref:phosphonate metabolism transcriptional regulator PhnF n=1 Tax=Rhizobium TaxID=379 RepID=UPI0008293A9D|nr:MULTISPECIES: phosphonate metabolism transcriptional regulator PhnF [Rhizobium]NTF42512.1 phosphonate metabolism transcriptional regulator PhnF [Rhizobium rhizogenes]OCI95645.1 phosphonate metabolism transcriptional regulator PhnF [Rhizobium sp. AC27/96]
METVDRKGGSALWHQIGEILAADIAAGTLAPGARLPTEPELMERFGVSRFTVRQALGHLEQRGLVRAEQGRGTFVHKGVLDYTLSKRTRFHKNLIEQGFEPGGELLAHEILPATERVAPYLKLVVGALVIHRRGVMTADGVPVELGDTYYPAERFPDFDKARLQHPTITAALASYGITDYERLSTEIEARMPTAEEARLLRQPKSVPLLVTRKVDVDMDGVPIAFSESMWSADRVIFNAELR